jgi:hypothetical protein
MIEDHLRIAQAQGQAAAMRQAYRGHVAALMLDVLTSPVISYAESEAAYDAIDWRIVARQAVLAADALIVELERRP